LVLEDEAFARVVKLLEDRPAATGALRELMRDGTR
jgi:hypothetical protein